jgi:hypothetical protein
MTLTKEQRFKEKVKCAMDPLYYLNTYGHVYNAKLKKVTKMECFDYQKKCVQDFHKYQNNIILKSRQCLPTDTLVDTPDGPKAIQNFKVGDLVYSYNLKTNKLEKDKIVDSWCSGKRQCVNISFDNGKKIEVGENHPLWVINRQDWIRAKDLKRGDEIVDGDPLIKKEGKNHKTILVKQIKKTSKKTCYDVTVEKNENFFTDGILVHNTGLSVITAGYVAWRLMFRYEERILIIANDGAGAIRFLATVKQFIDNTPSWLRPESKATDNQKKLEFSNGSWVEAKASSPNAGRGESLTMLVLDETAFIKDDEDIWMGAGMALSATKGKCIMISTPNGTGGLYHKTWIDAINGENDFNDMSVHWTENPQSSEGLEWRKDITTGKDIPWSPWYEEQCKRLGYDSVKIAQELDLSFEGSKYLAIDGAIIERYDKMTRNKKPNLFIKYDYLYKGTPQAGSFVTNETNFHVFKKPEPGRSYIVGVDVARGDGKDYSTIQVLDVETLEQVAEFRERIGVDLFPYLIDWVGRTYNNAFVVVEANSFGLGVGYDLRDKLQYKRLFYSKNTQEMHVRPYDYKVDLGVEIPGFQSTKTSRPAVVKSIVEHLREGGIIIHSQRLVAEMSTFIMNGDKPEAEKGYNDDLLMAYGIALYIRNTEYNNVSATKNMYKNMLDAMSFSTNSSFGVVKDEVKVPRKDIDIPSGSGGLFFGNGDTEDDDDLSWLTK